MRIDVEQFKSSVDIVNVVGEYVRLRKTGVRHVGLCPFHTEKTPSFSVHTVYQFYKCFGCGAGGDVLRFIMEIERDSFYEALKMLAERYGIELSGISVSDDERRLAAVDNALRAALEHAGFAEQEQRELFRHYRDRWRSDSEFRVWLGDDLEDTRRSTSWIVARLSVMTEALAA